MPNIHSVLEKFEKTISTNEAAGVSSKMFLSNVAKRPTSGIAMRPPVGGAIPKAHHRTTAGAIGNSSSGSTGLSKQQQLLGGGGRSTPLARLPEKKRLVQHVGAGSSAGAVATNGFPCDLTVTTTSTSVSTISDNDNDFDTDEARWPDGVSEDPFAATEEDVFAACEEEDEDDCEASIQHEDEFDDHSHSHSHNSSGHASFTSFASRSSQQPQAAAKSSKLQLKTKPATSRRPAGSRPSSSRPKLQQHLDHDDDDDFHHHNHHDEFDFDQGGFDDDGFSVTYPAEDDMSVYSRSSTNLNMGPPSRSASASGPPRTMNRTRTGVARNSSAASLGDSSSHDRRVGGMTRSESRRRMEPSLSSRKLLNTSSHSSTAGSKPATGERPVRPKRAVSANGPGSEGSGEKKAPPRRPRPAGTGAPPPPAGGASSATGEPRKMRPRPRPPTDGETAPAAAAGGGGPSAGGDRPRRSAAPRGDGPPGPRSKSKKPLPKRRPPPSSGNGPNGKPAGNDDSFSAILDASQSINWDEFSHS